MEYYSHKSIRKLVKALLETFSDIQIERRDQNGTLISHNPIPLVFGSSDRTTILRKHELDQMMAGNFNILPRGGLSMTAITKAPERNTGKLNTIINHINEENKLDYSMNCAAYDVAFELTFLSKTMTDSTVILETILPRFNPSINIRYKELDFDMEETSVPIHLDTINVDIADDFANNDIRLITTTFNIRAKTNIYHPITDSKLIEKIKIKLNAWDEQKVVFEDTTIEYPITSN